MGLPDGPELLARLGSAEIAARDVVSTLYPTLSRSDVEAVDEAHAVMGLAEGEGFEQAQCCKPIPGERIVGISYKGRGVIIHAIDCEVLKDLADQEHRWHDLRWHSGPHAAKHSATLELTISNDAGVLGRICTTIGEQQANISDLHFSDRKPDFYRLTIDIELRDTEHLHGIMLALEADIDVASVRRFRDATLKP
jgi:(p)ppGpp synthase/HD superfamily hydrolase